MDYRKEIDGLRAVAVVPVILFHAGFNLFSGGFVGVDVFFVISGFLITSIILDEISKGTFSILHFYERRARRILPALFVVVACCIPFAWFWMTPGEFNDFTKSVVAVSLFVSNIFFYSETDYFGFSAEEVPLLHTWSLAVEEQYYVFFPFFMLIVWRYAPRLLLWLILALAVLSFGLAQYASERYPTANFFLTPTRIWELMVGSACAIVIKNIKPAGSELPAAVGLGLILYSIFRFDEHTPFPSFYTLIPIVGAVLIILFARDKTLTTQLLSTRILVGIGMISFSAYLWHQPIFAFARIRVGADVTTFQFLLLSLATFLLAVASWRYVEQPFRDRQRPLLKSRQRIFLASGVFTAILAACALVMDNSNYFTASKTDRQRYFLQFLNYSEMADFEDYATPPECSLGLERNSFDMFDKEACLRLDETKPNYILMGDSHAGHLWRALSESYSDINILPVISSGCRPTIGFEGAKRCTDLTRYIFEDYLLENSVNGIILSSRWDQRSVESIEGTVRHLTQFVENVVIVGPTVEYLHDLPLILGAKNFENTPDLDRLAGPYLDLGLIELSKLFEERLADEPAQFVSVFDTLCSGKFCKTISDTGEPMLFDYGHMTVSGSRTFLKLLRNNNSLSLNY